VTFGVDFIKLFLPSKNSPAHKIFATQLHQQIKLQISSFDRHTFCQTLFTVFPIWAPKKALHLVHTKKLQAYVDEIEPRGPGETFCSKVPDCYISVQTQFHH